MSRTTPASEKEEEINYKINAKDVKRCEII